MFKIGDIVISRSWGERVRFKIIGNRRQLSRHTSYYQTECIQGNLRYPAGCIVNIIESYLNLAEEKTKNHPLTNIFK